MQDMRNEKTTDWKKQPDCIKTVKRHMLCGVCGSAISKRASITRGTRRWHCSNLECNLTLTMKDDVLEKTVIALLNQLIAKPELLEAQKPTEHQTSYEAIKLQNEINRELNKADINEEYLITLIFDCTAEKYALLDDGSKDRKIADLKTDLQNQKLLTAFDPVLFNNAVEALMIMADKTLMLKILGGNNITENGKEIPYYADN